MKSVRYPKNYRNTKLDRRQGQPGWMENNMMERRKSSFDRRIRLQQKNKNMDDPLVVYRSLYGKGFQN
jgi:hypothetical protein